MAVSNARMRSDKAALGSRFFIYGDTSGGGPGPGFPGNPNPIPLDPVPVSPDPTNPNITPPDPNRPISPPPITTPSPGTGVPNIPVVSPKDSSGVVADPLAKKPSKDPCAGREAVNERAGKKVVDGQNRNAMSMAHSYGKEHGGEQKFDNLTGKNLKDIPVRGGSSSQFTPHFTWNAKEGYTVGATHGHPSNSAPSPADALWGSKYVNQIPIDAGQRDLYTDYYQLVTITDHSMYVFTIKDVQAWVDLGVQFDKDRIGFNDRYQKLAAQYLRLNFTTNKIAAGEWALLKMVGNAVNLYKSSRTGVNADFKPLTIDGKNVKEDPCNP